jgi:hypothetical protein
VEVSKFCKEILVFRSPQKAPQVVSIQGSDLKTGKSLLSDQLDRTMLEIMNAS